MGLLKLAKKEKSREERLEEASYAPAALGAGAGGFLAARVGLPIVAKPVLHATRDKVISDAEAKALAEEMGAKGMKITKVPGMNNAGYIVHTGGNGKHKAYQGTIIADPEFHTRGTLAHELGHATGPLGGKNILSNPIKKGWLYAGGAGRLGNTLGITGGAAAARAAYKAKHDGEENRALQIADYAGRAGTGAMLAEEGQASARAIKAIAKLHGGKAAARAALELMPAFGTYAGMAAINHKLMPYLAAKNIREQAGIED